MERARCWFVLTAGLLTLLAGCRKYEVSSLGTSSLNKPVLFDFRDVSQQPEPSVPPSEAGQRVFAALFPRYMPQSRRCKPGSSHGVSNAAPRLLASADGAFTAAGLSQTAYLVHPGGCEDDQESFGESRLAIFSGDRVLTVARVSATDLLKITDLDGNGINEVLLANRSSGAGETIVTAHLLEFEKETFRVAENFGRVRQEACAPGADERGITAAVLFYLPVAKAKYAGEPTKMPRFTAELYRSACPSVTKKPAWTRIR